MMRVASHPTPPNTPTKPAIVNERTPPPAQDTSHEDSPATTGNYRWSEEQLGQNFTLERTHEQTTGRERESSSDQYGSCPTTKVTLADFEISPRAARIFEEAMPSD